MKFICIIILVYVIFTPIYFLTKELIEDIRRSNDQKTSNLYCNNPKITINLEKSHKIQNAINNQHKIKIRYISRKSNNDLEMTERIIIPLSFGYGKDSPNEYIRNSNYAANKLFLRAFCELRNDIRDFRLDRMEIIEIQAE